jgi:hypothetical protein
LDSVNFSAVSATRWPHLIGYLNGRVSAWSPGEIAETRADGRLLALVDVLGDSPLLASILDFERGDVQSPTVVRAWAQARNQYRHDATLYVAPPSISRAVSGLRGEPLNLIVVDLTADGEPPFEVPTYPGLPANVRVIGRQFVFGPKSGGAYDMSVIYADDWHPEQHAPVRLAAAALAAAPELGRYSAAAAATVSAGQLPGQLALGQEPEPDPKPAGSPGGTTSSASPSTPSPAPTPAPDVDDVSTLPATAAAAADTGHPVPPSESPAPSSSSPAPATAPAWPDAWPPTPDSSASSPSSSTLTPFAQAIADVQATPTAQGWQSSATGERLLSPVDADPLFAEHELAAGRRAVTAAAGPSSALDHEFIRSTLNDIHQVAGMFRHGGWGNVAVELERVAGIAWEIGSALKAAGL